jgi:hypothetical protein
MAPTISPIHAEVQCMSERDLSAWKSHGKREKVEHFLSLVMFVHHAIQRVSNFFDIDHCRLPFL